VETYLPSLALLTRLDASMVVYTQDHLVDRLTRFLDRYCGQALVIGRELESARLFEEIQAIRLRQGFLDRPERDRCHVLCHAKLDWLAEQANANPFAADRLYWIDAGLASDALFPYRYLAPSTEARPTPFAPTTLDRFAHPGSAAPLTMLGIWPFPWSQIHGIPLAAHQAWVGVTGAPVDRHIVGGFFGGEAAAIHDLADESHGVLDAMLADDYLGTEENVLSVLYHRDPARADLRTFSTWYHEDTPFTKPRPEEVSFYRLFAPEGERNASRSQVCETGSIG
jgi:hypothetical protein